MKSNQTQGAGAFNAITEALPESSKDLVFEALRLLAADESPEKFNGTIGMYHDEENKFHIPSAVKKAIQWVAQNPELRYQTLRGYLPFQNLMAEYCLGTESQSLNENRVSSVQTLGGSGACYMFFQTIKLYYQNYKKVYLPLYHWANYTGMCKFFQLDVQYYEHYDVASGEFLFNRLLEQLQNAEVGSVWIFNGNAQNPTGQDPTIEEWHMIFDIAKKRDLCILMDSAYVGFTSGDIDTDLYPIRMMFDEHGMTGFVALSFSKNMSLYGERVGCLLSVSSNQSEAQKMQQCFESLGRVHYTHGPSLGAQIVHKVLTTPDLLEEWKLDVSNSANRLNWVRSKLAGHLLALQVPGNWNALRRQSGMFILLDITPKQVAHLREKHSIHILDNGRICISSINKNNVEIIAEAIRDALAVVA